MNGIYITNDIITDKTLKTSAAEQPANPSQGTFTNAQLPQNVVELSKFFLSLHVPENQINATALISSQDMAYNLIREKMLIAFPTMANLINHEQLIRQITAAVYQWANTSVPKTPIKV